MNYRSEWEIIGAAELGLREVRSGLVEKRRYSTQPTSPLRPMTLLPGAGFGLLLRWQLEEFHGFGFQFGEEIHGDSVVDHFEETQLFAGVNNEGFGARFGQVHGGDSEGIRRSRSRESPNLPISDGFVPSLNFCVI